MKVQENDKGYRFVEWRSGAHDHKSHKLWINQHIPLIEEDGDELVFPCRGELVRTERGGMVLRPGVGTVYVYAVASGYRGSSDIETIDGGTAFEQFAQLHSGQGSLGNTTVAIIQASGSAPVSVHWYRSGRRVDQTRGTTRLWPDGTVESLLDADVENLL